MNTAIVEVNAAGKLSGILIKKMLPRFVLLFLVMIQVSGLYINELYGMHAINMWRVCHRSEVPGARLQHAC